MRHEGLAISVLLTAFTSTVVVQETRMPPDSATMIGARGRGRDR